MRVIGFVVIVIIILMGIYNSGDLGSFIDAGAMLVVLAGLVGGVLMSGGPETWAGIGCAFSGEPLLSAFRPGSGSTSRPDGLSRPPRSSWWQPARSRYS